MILSAHQPQFLPGPRLLAKIAKADLHCYFDGVQFSRHEFENRQWIKTYAGPQMLTVPVQSKDHFNTLGKDVRICRTNWGRKHLRALELAYSRAPYFNEYFTPLAPILMAGHELLADLNLDLLKWMLRECAITTKIVRASDYSFTGVKSGLVLNMARTLKATKYLFGERGEDYADVQAFACDGIDVEFQKYDYPTYQQLHGTFLPNLSALDMLFNLGPKARNVLLSGNSRVTTEAA